MKAFFISDVHIQLESKEKGVKLLKFLKELPADTTHLILLGDIFDWWMGSHSFFVQKYPFLITEFRKLKSRGIDVHYFEGNHDLQLKGFWGKTLGFKVHTKPFYFQLGDLTIRAEHGDQMNPDDKAYLFLRSFLRSLPLKGAVWAAPGRLTNFIGERFSKMSRVYSERVNHEYKLKVLEMTRAHALKAFSKKPFDLLITGHTHVDDDFLYEVAGKKVRSINLGSWLDKPKTLMVTPDEQKIIYV